MKKITKIDLLTGYEVFIIVGILMTLGTALKLFANYEFSSDWFWFLVGIGFVVE